MLIFKSHFMRTDATRHIFKDTWNNPEKNGARSPIPDRKGKGRLCRWCFTHRELRDHQR